MYRRFCIAISLLCIAAFGINTAHSADHIKIASFNIADFGEGSHPATRDLDFIAKTIVDEGIDLLAIQEVGVIAKGQEQVEALASKMNSELAAGAPQYFSFVTPVSGDERCAVIYRFLVILEDGLLWLDDDKSPSNPGAGGKKFYLTPVGIPFRAGNFDFYIVVCHLAWGDLDRREDEVNEIRKFLINGVDWEGDWIVLGDMNRYGKYAKSATGKAWDKLLRSNWKTKYRFPLLEAITDPDDMKVWKASTDAESTTVAQSKNLYDQFIITAGAFNEFGTTTPTLGTDVGILPFDTQSQFSSLDHNTVKYRVSDHRPIWIRFRTDLQDDD